MSRCAKGLYFFSAIALVSPFVISGQTCTIISPTAAQIFQNAAAVQFTATVLSAPTAYSLEWDLDNHRWAVGYVKDPHPEISDFRDGWSGPWAVTWYGGMNGDGPHFVSGILRDIFGNTLTTCASVNFIVRIEGMSNQILSSLPSSGAGALTFQDFTRTTTSCCMMAVDGRSPDGEWDGGVSNTSSGWSFPNLKTYRFPNGMHEVLGGYNLATFTAAYGQGDPIVNSQTFTSSNISGSNIALPNHVLANGATVVFSSTGTLPAPLVAGQSFYWATSNSNPSNTATFSVANGVMTVTCSSSCGATAGTPVYLRNVASTNQITGLPNCDGYYTAAAGSGTSFTVTAPSGCPDGVGITNTIGGAISPIASFEVDVNPYFVQYTDPNDIGVSATPGGSALTLTSGGSGTHTITTRLRSPYWTDYLGNSDLMASGGVANVMYMATFNNGTYPMELRPPWWELHLIAGGPAVSVCPKIANTDGTFRTLACNTSGLSYTLVNDGGLSGVATVDSNGNVNGLMPGWAQVQVACNATCNTTGSGESLPTVTVYVQVHSGSVTFPHFTHAGPIASSFIPGSSFFPISFFGLSVYNATAIQQNLNYRISWLGPAMNEANVNSSLYSLPVDLGDPTVSACPSWPTLQHGYEEAFASTYNTYFETDLFSGYWGSGGNFNGPVGLSNILSNLGYNRQACVQAFVSHDVSVGRTWRYYNDDEASDEFGTYLMPNPAIGGPNWTNATTSGGTITFNVQNVNTPNPWVQSSGYGNAVKITGATNACLNGWFLFSSTSPTLWTAPTTCPSGNTYNATTDPSAKMIFLYSPAGCTPDSGCDNISAIPSNTTAYEQPWSAALTTIVVNGSTATVYWKAHGITDGTAIRIHRATTANLNIIAPITYVDADTFTYTYPGSTGGAAPSSGTYNASTDAGLFITVDPNFPPNPMLAFRSLITGVTNHPAESFSMLGSLFNRGNGAGVYSWMGNPVNTDAPQDYVPNPLAQVYGIDTTVWMAAHYSQSSSGLATRAYQLQPRTMLPAVGWYMSRGCRSFEFNPVCDRPFQLQIRPETITPQLMGMLALNAAGFRTYFFAQDPYDQYALGCCGWQANGYEGGGNQINPYINAKQWAAMAQTNAAIKLNEKYYLEPQCNAPYYGPMFITTCHTSSYGAYLQITSSSETPYQQTIDLTPVRIPGGSIRRESITGYRLSITPLSGNPTSDTYNFGAAAPGETVIYISQPAGTPADIDNITLAPPATLPYGASRFLVQVGYYPRAMQDDPITDCTSACTIAVDHHNTDAWYRIIYADSNNLPLSTGDPVKIPSQGLN
ncbi:MAG: hypothetical protein JOZ32_14745 [Bryobacterales bacterium]|nr:hypothetical protein [Bryobacterales bacterium]